MPQTKHVIGVLSGYKSWYNTILAWMDVIGDGIAPEFFLFLLFMFWNTMGYSEICELDPGKLLSKQVMCLSLVSSFGKPHIKKKLRGVQTL